MIFSRLKRAALALLTSDEPLKALDEEAKAAARLDCRTVGRIRRAKYEAVHRDLARTTGRAWR